MMIAMFAPKTAAGMDGSENWRFAIGLQRVDGLSVSPFLVELARKNIEGLMTNEEVQRAVRAHYSKQPKSPNP